MQVYDVYLTYGLDGDIEDIGLFSSLDKAKQAAYDNATDQGIKLTPWEAEVEGDEVLLAFDSEINEGDPDEFEWVWSIVRRDVL